MFKGRIIGPIAVTANTNIPIASVFNTNTNILHIGPTMSILKPGLYEVNVTANAEGVTEEVALNLLNNDTAIPGDTSPAVPAAATDPARFVINDTLKVESQVFSSVRLSLQFTEDITVNDLIITIKKIR